MTADPVRLLRNLSVYSALALATLVGLSFVWSLGILVHLEVLGRQDPQLAARFQELQSQHLVGEAVVKEVFRLAGHRLDWFLLAAVASLLTFPLMGWLCGRYAPDPSWAGILPVVDLLGGMNPVFPRGLAADIPTLPLDEQVALLVCQVLVTHVAAQWSAERRERAVG